MSRSTCVIINPYERGTKEHGVFEAGFEAGHDQAMPPMAGRERTISDQAGPHTSDGGMPSAKTVLRHRIIELRQKADNLEALMKHVEPMIGTDAEAGLLQLIFSARH